MGPDRSRLFAEQRGHRGLGEAGPGAAMESSARCQDAEGASEVACQQQTGERAVISPEGGARARRAMRRQRTRSARRAERQSAGAGVKAENWWGQGALVLRVHVLLPRRGRQGSCAKWDTGWGNEAAELDSRIWGACVGDGARKWAEVPACRCSMQRRAPQRESQRGRLNRIIEER